MSDLLVVAAASVQSKSAGRVMSGGSREHLVVASVWEHVQKLLIMNEASVTLFLRCAQAPKVTCRWQLLLAVLYGIKVLQRRATHAWMTP